ncbi:MAG: Endoribonuclease YbeY [Desulfotomaculum sp. 46_80]|nr:MAG: Endoribonuclease YbeY [Desulfotomaculum sp. 46_80]
MPVYVNSFLEPEADNEEELVKVAVEAVREVLSWGKISDLAEVSVVFVSEEYIQYLNNLYRQIDSPTDVLSFAMQEGESLAGMEEEIILGDVVIALAVAEKQSVEQGHSLEQEVACLVVHGALHLLGYDHMTDEEETAMRSSEKEILKKLGWNVV